MQSFKLILALAATALVVSSDAASWREEATQTIVQATQGLQHAADSALSRNQEGKAVILVEYAVPPPVQGEFVGYFKELLGHVEKEEEAVKVFGLSRTVDENLSFYVYTEWEGFRGNSNEGPKPYVKDYIENISKIGVVYKIHFLDQIAFIKPQ